MSIITPPSGSPTFLATDIEGSTRLWEHQPETMRAALARHDALLRQAVESAGGYVFKSLGDGILASFERAGDALGAALAIQRQMLATDAPIVPLRVRVALTSGPAELRDRDYFGQPLNRLARLISAGHGGQILLAEATRQRLADALPTGISLRDMGERRLKDLIQPEHIYQVVAPDLRSDFPPLLTLDERPNNLPAQRTPFLGRETQLADIRRLIAEGKSRLITLTGPGGSGKTRLALHVAAEMADEFEHGVFFVELDSLSDPDLVPSTIAQVFGLTEASETPVLDTLREHLHPKQLLLLLDNFEQVIGAAPVVTDLLRAAPRLVALVTSRVLLRVYGEQGYEVPPMDYPTPQQRLSTEEIAACEAVQLFVARAQAHRPDFALTPENAWDIAEICYRLDGLPLAIELAAARARAVPVHAMVGQLTSRLRFLTGGARDLPARQQTLRGAIQWSYNLLAGSERVLFRRMSVFVGGTTLETLLDVCALSGEPPSLADLDTLGNGSLVQQSESAGESRYSMLETIREYAREQLIESGEHEQMQNRHLACFVALAHAAEGEFYRERQAEWFERLEREHDNFRAALQWALESGECITGLDLAVALSPFWNVRGHWTEGREWLRRVLEGCRGVVGGSATSAMPTMRTLYARGLSRAGTLARYQGDYDTARRIFEESLDLARAGGDRANAANALYDLGIVTQHQGDYAASRAYYEQSLAIRKELGSAHETASALMGLGIVAHNQGDYDAACGLLEEGLEIARTAGDQRAMAIAFGNLGIISRAQGDYDAAVRHSTESLRLSRELGDRRGIAISLDNLGVVAYLRGEHDEARRLLEEDLAISRELGDKRGVAYALGDLGFICLHLGEAARARALYADSLRLRHDVGDRRGIALCLIGIAALTAETTPERAARLVEHSGILLAAMQARLTPMEESLRARAVAAARARLGPVGYYAAQLEGRALSTADAIAAALADG